MGQSISNIAVASDHGVQQDISVKIDDIEFCPSCGRKDSDGTMELHVILGPNYKGALVYHNSSSGDHCMLTKEE